MSDSPPTNAPAKQSGKLVSAIVGIGFLAIAAFLFLRPAPDPLAKNNNRPPPPVLVAQVERRLVPQSIESLGTVNANEIVTLSSKVTERIDSIHFVDGQDVEAGHLLFQLYDDEQEAQLMEAQANLQERERQLARLRSVGDSGAVSASALDEELTRYDSAQAQLKLYESRVADRRIVAPFAGRLGLRRVSPGELVSPGTELISVSDLTPVKVDFTVPEQNVGRIAPGQTIEATSIAFPGETFIGEIASVSPVIDAVSRAAQARAIIQNDDLRLRPGMLLRVNVVLGQMDVLLVPESALSPLGNRQFVFLVTAEGLAQKVEVKTGARINAMVVVLDGLAEGQTVITHGHRAVDGQKVVLTEPSKVFTVQPEQPRN